MSNNASSSKVTLESDYLFYSFLPLTEYPSSSKHASASSSHQLEPTTSIAKPKPIMTKQSLRRLGYHSPYQIGDTAYLRSNPTSPFDEYTFKGTHISPLSTENDTYYTSVFESSGDLAHTRFTIDVEEDHEQDTCCCLAPKLFVWLGTLFRAFVWLIDIIMAGVSGLVGLVLC